MAENRLIPPPQAGQYKVVVADPPWRFETYSEKGLQKSADMHYETMTFDDICELPVGEWLAKDAILIMWVTFPMLEKIFSPRISWNDDGTVI